jgi:uncharacterized membrane protein YccC
VNDAYATEPMCVVLPSTQLPREEEVYSAFEQALSDRQVALHQKLQRLSSAQITTQLKHTLTHQREHSQRSITLQRAWRLAILSGIFAFIFTLLGFDLFGILLLLLK